MVDDEPTPSAVTVYRLTLRYDGRAYQGWQRHQGKPTVQGAVEAAVEEIVGARCTVHGSGRTDRGAHADGQVAHFAAPFRSPPEELLADFDRVLPSDIEVLECVEAPADFHAREGAVAKTYRFELWSGPDCPAERIGRVWHVAAGLRIDAMRAASSVLVGRHDFASFAKKTNYDRKSTVRNLMSVELDADGPHIVFRFRADGFLYKMVRNLVRAIVKVGEGRSTPAKLEAILQARDRKMAPGTAPASGLYLESVEYDA
ncbi:MAG: tRNA pseudouridine(38-40) synthase TruA [Myxococcota bacterium]